MRHSLPAVCVIVAIAAAAPSGAAAQTIIDLSTPRAGLSRFVLNADLTPAMLGAPAEEKQATEPTPVSARVPACGEGCTMQQPQLQKPLRGAPAHESGSQRSNGGTRVYIVAGGGGQKTTQPTAQPQQQPAPRKTFRFRRR